MARHQHNILGCLRDLGGDNASLCYNRCICGGNVSCCEGQGEGQGQGQGDSPIVWSICPSLCYCSAAPGVSSLVSVSGPVETWESRQYLVVTASVPLNSQDDCRAQDLFLLRSIVLSFGWFNAFQLSLNFPDIIAESKIMQPRKLSVDFMIMF